MKIVKRLDELKKPERISGFIDKQIKEFRRSIEMFGLIRLVIDENNVILAGNDWLKHYVPWDAQKRIAML